MNLQNFTVRLAVIGLFLMTQAVFIVRAAGGEEYVGQFETSLVADKENLERAIFNASNKSEVRGANDLSDTAYVSSNRLQNPTGQSSLIAFLVEEQDEKPFIYVDLNSDNNFTNDEKFVFKREKSDNPFLFITSFNVPVKNSFLLPARFFSDISEIIKRRK